MYEIWFIFNVKINNNEHDHIHHRHENDFRKGKLIHFYKNQLISIIFCMIESFKIKNENRIQEKR